MASLYNRALMTTATTGTGTVTLGAAFSNSFCTFAEAGVPDGTTVSYVIEEGLDFEVGTGVYTASGTTLSRASVTISKIGGTQGTSKMNLAGNATVRITARAEDFNALAPLASPTFTGSPAAPTATAGDSSTLISTTAFVQLEKPWKIVKKTADESVTSSTTFQNDDALAFSISANKSYLFRAALAYSAAASGGIKFQWTGPASPTLVGMVDRYDGISGGNAATAFSSVMLSLANAATKRIYEVIGIIQNGANAGTAQLQWAQNTTNGTATTVFKGAAVEYVQLD